jgi:iron complex outermembrane receptor protein
VKNFEEYIDDYDNGGQIKNVYPESDLGYSPSVIGSFDLGFYPVKNFSANLLGKYAGEQYLDNTSNKARMMDAFYTQDIRLGYDLLLNKIGRLSFIFQVNNLFDAMYEPNGYTYSYFAGNELTTENYYFPMAGRNWMLGVNVRF